MRARWSPIVAVLLMAASSALAADRKITLGAAANFMAPLVEIADLFEARTGIRAERVFTSTGGLYAQIVNGAPYDVFLSADEERPGKLFKKGLAKRPFVYARGSVVLWAPDRRFCAGSKDWIQALKSAGVKKVAVANPETAPYGAAAMAALKAAGLLDLLEGNIVFPQDIGQAFQYASARSVDAAFCAMSSALSEEGKKGCCLPVAQAPVVVQAACVLCGSADIDAAERFAEFLLSPAAVQVNERYGYR